jgi:hypothetical protein
MEEISFSKFNWNERIFEYGCIALICSAVVVGVIYFEIKTIATNAHNMNFLHNKRILKDVLSAPIAAVISSFFAKYLFETVVSFLRFYNLKIKVFNAKLVLQTEKKKYEIPMTKRTNIMYYMHGWLISWPSEKGEGIILLTEDLLGNHFLDFCIYFQERTNYIPSRNIIHTTQYGIPISQNGFYLDDYQPNADYDAAAEIQKKLLKLLHINKWNRLKYIKWPSEKALMHGLSDENLQPLSYAESASPGKRRSKPFSWVTGCLLLLVIVQLSMIIHDRSRLLLVLILLGTVLCLMIIRNSIGKR